MFQQPATDPKTTETAAGEAFLQSARRTLRNIKRDIEETRSIGRGEVGSLHIGFVGSGMLTGANHPRAKQKSISPAALRDEPFIYFPRAAGARAFEKPLTIFEQYGLRPNIVQEASHWLTILRLIGAGLLGVSIAPECVRTIASPDVVCLTLRDAKVLSSVDLALLVGESRTIVGRFAHIVKSARH